MEGSGTQAHKGQLGKLNVKGAGLGFRKHCANVTGGDLAAREHVREQFYPFTFDPVGNHAHGLPEESGY